MSWLGKALWWLARSNWPNALVYVLFLAAVVMLLITKRCEV